jgi:hypothetical protein
MDNLKLPGGILLGIPFTRHPVPEWAMSIVTQSYPIGTNLTIFTTKYLEVGEARNQIADKAVELDTRYVWFVDDDTAPPNFAARKLIYELEKNGPPFDKAMVCGGIYCTKEDPPYPIVFKEEGQGAYWDWKVGDVFECNGIGTGCMMIRTELFKKLPKPWFKTVDIEPTDAKQFKHQMTDDLYFCRNVREAGYKILAHGGVIPIHWDEKTETPFMLPTGCPPLREYEAAMREGISLTDWKNKQEKESAAAQNAGLSLEDWRKNLDKEAAAFHGD